MPAEERGHEDGTPRPWAWFYSGIGSISIGIATLATICEFWRQW